MLRILFALLWLASIPVAGITAEYDIKSLGLRIATLSVSTSIPGRYVSVKAKSLISNAIFPELDNSYRTEFDQDFMPQRYTRVIRQKKHADEVLVTYDHARKLANATHSGELGSYSFPLAADTRDFFSFFTYLAQGVAMKKQYSIDGNGCLWLATLTNQGRETISTPLGAYRCTRYLISFEQVSEKKMPYVDMVTHNLLNAKSKVTLWISNGHLAVEAQVRKGALSMSWELIGVSN